MVDTPMDCLRTLIGRANNRKSSPRKKYQVLPRLGLQDDGASDWDLGRDQMHSFRASAVLWRYTIAMPQDLVYPGSGAIDYPA